MTTLPDAIIAVEAAFSALGSADAATQAAQQKYDSAANAKIAADQAGATAVATYNASLDTLIASATAAKINR